MISCSFSRSAQPSSRNRIKDRFQQTVSTDANSKLDKQLRSVKDLISKQKHTPRKENVELMNKKPKSRRGRKEKEHLPEKMSESLAGCEKIVFGKKWTS